MAASRIALTAFVRRYSSKLPTGGSAVSGHGEEGVKLWRNISLFVGGPALILCTLNTYLTHEHHERPEYVPYEYLCVRNKRFPWGDGQRSFFHNPHTNALPGGYEA